MQSNAKTVREYLASLPKDRRTMLEAVRKVILKNLDHGFEEGMTYVMMGYYVPHRLYPAGYHCDPKMPLPFAGLASQKHYMSVYLLTSDEKNDDRAFRKAWAQTGKKLDMGLCCIRFKKLDDLALDVIGETIARWPLKKYIAFYESTIRPTGFRKIMAKARRRVARQSARPKARGGVHRG
jgi:hypothetical protein